MHGSNNYASQQHTAPHRDQSADGHCVVQPYSIGALLHPMHTLSQRVPQLQTTAQHPAARQPPSRAATGPSKVSLSGCTDTGDNSRISPNRPQGLAAADTGCFYQHPTESQVYGRGNPTHSGTSRYRTSCDYLEQANPGFTQRNKNTFGTLKSLNKFSVTANVNGGKGHLASEQETPMRPKGLIHSIPTAEELAKELAEWKDSGDVVGIVDPTFEPLIHPKGFFKKGRVFMTLWVEPKGYTEADLAADGRICVRAFTELARFAVIRNKSSHCLCLRISTYSGKGTTRPGIVTADHAVVIPVGEQPAHLPLGEELIKGFLPVKVETEHVTISPMSRMNFTKVYTIEYNIRVRNIGRVDNSSLAMFEDFFLSSLGLNK